MSRRSTAAASNAGACGSPEGALHLVDDQAELDRLRPELDADRPPASAPTNYGRPDPDADLLD